MSHDRRRAALYVLCLGQLMVILDVTVVNVALPAIQADLRFSQAGLAWVVNAYLIGFGGLLLLCGRLGDLLGRREVLLAGVGLFTAASAVCGLAASPEVLVGARFVQGIGGALSSAVILGMIVTLFPEPAEQARAIGIYSFVSSAGGSLGLLVGGALVQLLDWHWIFSVNLPIGLMTLMLALRLVPREAGLGLRNGADTPGALLITAALMLAVVSIVGTADAGWGATRTLVLGAMALVLLAGFVARQASAATPLMPLRVLTSRTTAAANAVGVLMVVGIFGLFFLGALYLQQVLGYDAIRTGLAFLPITLAIGGLSLGFSARLSLRFGPKAVLLAGLALVVASLALFARLPVRGDYLVDVLPGMLLYGTGFGLAFAAVMNLAMTDATPDDAGLASGLFNTSQQVGGALGLSLLAMLSTSRTDDLLAAGAAQSDALTDGFGLAFAVAALAALAALALAAIALPGVERLPHGGEDASPPAADHRSGSGATDRAPVSGPWTARRRTSPPLP